MRPDQQIASDRDVHAMGLVPRHKTKTSKKPNNYLLVNRCLGNTRILFFSILGPNPIPTPILGPGARALENPQNEKPTNKVAPKASIYQGKDCSVSCLGVSLCLVVHCTMLGGANQQICFLVSNFVYRLLLVSNGCRHNLIHTL